MFSDPYEIITALIMLMNNGVFSIDNTTNIGVSASYYKPKEHEVLEDYLRASDHLTIGGDKKILEKQICELTEKQDEITFMHLKHEKEMQEIRQQMNHIVSLIQENPKLAKVKTDILTRL